MRNTQKIILMVRSSIMTGKSDKSNMSKRAKFSGSSGSPEKGPGSEGSIDRMSETKTRPVKWSLGILNDKETDEVPGTQN